MGDVYMPRLSDSMTEGTISEWLKDDGEHVVRGEAIVDIETDKATMAFETDETGTLHIVEPAGAIVPVGAVIASIGARPVLPAPSVEMAQEKEDADPDEPSTAEPSTRVSRLSISPLARKVAKDLGVDISAVEGTGLGGRVLKTDVEAAATAHAKSASASVGRAQSSSDTSLSGTDREYQVVHLSRVQKTIAQRMAETKSSVPEFSVTCDVDMDPARALQGQMRRLSRVSNGSGAAPSINDLVLKAVGLALREHPRANARFVDGQIELSSRINVGFAVAVDDALFVPVVADVDQLSIWQVSERTKELVRRVRGDVISPGELSGGTFTVSNLGMFGVTDFTAIINAGQAAILSVGTVQETPVVRSGSIVVGYRMRLTLTCDHRILYGSDAARLLQTIRSLLELPVALVVSA